MLKSDRDALAAQNCVLCVVDKQRWYFDPQVSPFATDEMTLDSEMGSLDGMILLARSAGVPVVWTRNSEGAEYSPPNTLRRWRLFDGEPRLSRGDVGFEFFGDQPTASEAVFDKVYPDAFSAEGFREHMKGLRRETFVLIGGYASRCLLATAFTAQTLGYTPFLVEGLTLPHPWFPKEVEGVEQIVNTLVGGVVAPADVAEIWRASL